MRGIRSMANVVTRRAASASTTGLFCDGYKNEISVAPSLSACTSPIEPSLPVLGARTLSSTSLSANTASRSTRVAPACTYASSGNCASAPARFSTRTREKPFFSKRAVFCGVSATRRSFGYDSRGTPTVSDEYGVPAILIRTIQKADELNIPDIFISDGFCSSRRREVG